MEPSKTKIENAASPVNAAAESGAPPAITSGELPTSLAGAANVDAAADTPDAHTVAAPSPHEIGRRSSVPPVDLSPLDADLELPQDLRERHARIKADIENIGKKRQAATFERNRTRETLSEQFDLKKMERVRVLRSQLLKLSQEELKTRRDLNAWLSDCLPAMEAISKKTTDALAAVKQEVLEKLHSIGFSEVAGEPNRGKFLMGELIAMHPDVTKMFFRLRAVSHLIDGLINRGREGSPFHHNDLRIKAVAAELHEAVKNNEQFISMI